MRRSLVFGLIVCLALGLALIGCGTKKAASSQQAIEVSKTLQTAQAKVDYLLQQAQAFYNSKNFQESVNVAQYVLNYLDRNSQEAKNLLEKAKSELAALAQKKLDELKTKGILSK